MFHESDGGFSTVGMVLAMLVTLSLVFSTAQVYRVQSAAADVQNVADAAALAAENQVASFYVVAQTCDAIILSMSLTGIAVAGVGVVCLCIPPTAELSAKFIEASHKIFRARDKFSTNASKGLDKVQKLLPFFASAQAFAVAQANDDVGGSYLGCAVLLPFQGDQIEAPELEGAEETMEKIEEEDDEIRQAAQRAEDAAEEANEHKRAAYMADCGNDPEYCMYERAASLAGLSGSQNPYYASVDAWSFSVAMRRAKAYYPRRLAQESITGATVEEQADSVIRQHFYEYAVSQIARGYVHENEQTGAFDAYFPLLPKNTSEMRSTSLYTQCVYPITVDDEGNETMHAWHGCPLALEQDWLATGSVAQLEGGGFETCPLCQFRASSVGKVAAASSSIQNGFEYHYRIIAEEAEAYQEAKERMAPNQQKVKDKAGELMDMLEGLFGEAMGSRIHVKPPGHYGAVAIVASTQGVPARDMFPSSFVSGNGQLGTRAAISAATLAEDDSDETKSVLTSLLDGFKEEPGGISAASMVLSLWSSLLNAYCDGQEALEAGVRNTLNKIPFASASGLGTWAEEKLKDVISEAGLEPVQLHAFKPVLVNSSHVLQADSGSFAQGLLSVKTAYASVSVSASPLAGALGAVEPLAADAVVDAEDELVIATVELLGIDSASIPFSIALPPAVRQATTSVVESVFSQLQGIASSGSGVRRWE
ncbi:MAG: molybdenum cofactor biosynthesis enzyme [Eggerthellaceae bacterium]|nr:molybdenum cofactor biosynthesis enzyme [Eggerthellaceae bacterium]